MLARLRHHRIVGRDHEQRGIDARRAGHHRVNESFMPGNVDQREARAVVVEMRESQLDRDAAAFLLGQSIDRAAGQRVDERRFAVVDMPGQANHELRTSSDRRREHPTRPRNGLFTHVSCHDSRCQPACESTAWDSEQRDGNWYKCEVESRIRGTTMTDPIRLTQLAKRAGCAAKQPPGYLLSLLGIAAADHRSERAGRQRHGRRCGRL